MNLVKVLSKEKKNISLIHTIEMIKECASRTGGYDRHYIRLGHWGDFHAKDVIDAWDYVNMTPSQRFAMSLNDTEKPMKKVNEEEKENADTVNVEALMTSINNLRTRNSELVSKVGKMKNEIKSANDRIAELEKMLDLATLKIAELEDANEELSIYKELVEDETKIEE